MFSELKPLSQDLGLDWFDREKGGCLKGLIKDYPLAVTDDFKNREYIVTLFCRYRENVGKPLREGITGLIEALPKNSVVGRKSEVNFQQIRLNAAFLYQENSGLLVDFVKGLCDLADSLDLLPAKYDPVIAEESTALKSEKKASAKKREKFFDRYSLRGLVGAVIGGFAMSAIAGAVVDSRPQNIGGMLASWAMGALISAITIGDYRLFAKKIDIFGILCCSLITAWGCVFTALFGGVRMLKRYAGLLFPEITLGDTVRNYSYYQIIFPEASGEFPMLLIKLFVSAIAGAAIFYTLYFRKNAALMLE